MPVYDNLRAVDPAWSVPSPSNPVRYGLATAAVLAGTAAAFVLRQQLGTATLSLVFLTVVIFTAARWGLGPSLWSALLSFLAFNFLFTAPYYTLFVDSKNDFITLVFFLITATLAGNLAARMRKAVDHTESALRRISNLYRFSRRLSAAQASANVLEALVEHLASTLHCGVAMLSAEEGAEPRVRIAQGEPPDGQALAQAERVWRKGENLDAATSWRFVALGTTEHKYGLLALHLGELDEGQLELVRALCDQALVAMERARLSEDLEKAHVTAETERLRAALLASVSHDLRTPLASIIGSTSSLIDIGDKLGPEQRSELLQTVLGEAERLNRYIQNLLDMTRLGHGGLQLHRDWVDINDILSAALSRLRLDLGKVRVEIAIAPEATLLYVHGALLEQALVNLLDNAARYSPEGGVISIEARRRDEALIIDVTDQGPGIPEAERDKVFDMFYSIGKGDRGAAGTGLGLAICRGLIGAHGGQVEVLAGPDGKGARMRITLPWIEYVQAGP
jgi:two-component system, OmpR family, sensor histidine kinase KdpD